MSSIRQIDLDYDGSILGFYEKNLGPLPDGQNVDCTKIKISSADRVTIRRKLVDWLSDQVKEKKADVSPDDLQYAANLRMLFLGPSVDETLPAGKLRILKGCLVAAERKA